MEYPHYTFDGCHWYAYLSSQRRIVLTDMRNYCTFDFHDDSRHPSIFYEPGLYEMPVTATRFKASKRRIVARIQLELDGKPAEHLVPDGSDWLEHYTWKNRNLLKANHA